MILGLSAMGLTKQDIKLMWFPPSFKLISSYYPSLSLGIIQVRQKPMLGREECLGVTSPKSQ